jgi:hypothetical protein
MRELGAASRRGRPARRRPGRRPGRGIAARASGAAPRRWQVRDRLLHQRAQARLQTVEGPLGVAEAVLGAPVPHRRVPVLARLRQPPEPRSTRLATSTSSSIWSSSASSISSCSWQLPGHRPPTAGRPSWSTAQGPGRCGRAACGRTTSSSWSTHTAAAPGWPVRPCRPPRWRRPSPLATRASTLPGSNQRSPACTTKRTGRGIASASAGYSQRLSYLWGRLDMADSNRPSCEVMSSWVGSVRSHCVLPRGHRGKHSWEWLREAAAQRTVHVFRDRPGGWCETCRLHYTEPIHELEVTAVR